MSVLKLTQKCDFPGKSEKGSTPLCEEDPPWSTDPSVLKEQEQSSCQGAREAINVTHLLTQVTTNLTLFNKSQNLTLFLDKKLEHLILCVNLKRISIYGIML